MEREGCTAETQAGSPVRTPSKPCRILLVDDHPLLRAMMRGVLRDEPDLEVVGEAKNGWEAIELCLSQRPDIVLMDVSMPDMDGIAATREIKTRWPRTIILMVSARDSPKYMMEAIVAGAAGYVLKDATPERLLNAVRRALDGESPLNQELAMRLLKRLSDGADRPVDEAVPDDARNDQRTSPTAPERPLTVRETEVLVAMAVGKTNRRIAEELTISRATVKTHVERVISKLGVSDRTQAAVRAVKLGLVADWEQ